MSEKPSEKKIKGQNDEDDVLGYCYLNRSCSGAKAAEYPISFEECQEVGGGSWMNSEGDCIRT